MSLNEVGTSPALASSSTTTNSKTIRPEMVESARQLLLNARVKQTPFQEQKQFLRAKGVSDEEINEAIKSFSPLNFASNDPSGYGQGTPQNRVIELAKSAVVVGSASYFAYRFVRTWVLPKFFDIPDPYEEKIQRLQTRVEELQESNRKISENVAQTLKTITEQNEQISRSLLVLSSSNANKSFDFKRLHSDIGIVKSLLLNQSPPIIKQNGVLKLPDWQLKPSEDELGRDGQENGKSNGGSENVSDAGSSV